MGTLGPGRRPTFVLTRVESPSPHLVVLPCEPTPEVGEGAKDAHAVPLIGPHTPRVAGSVEELVSVNENCAVGFISYMLHTRSTCLFTEIVPDAHYAPPEGLLAAGLGASGGALQVALWTFQCALWQVRSQ